MGLKLKWFRRRLTFEGIPSAPERNTRRKEQNTGITVIGVYRQSVNYEDYIEPTRSSYWEPPSQSFVTTTIRKPTTSAPTAAPSRAPPPPIVDNSLEKRAALDKITPLRTTTPVTTGRYETPPEPSYSPPKPPVRTKSTPNVSSVHDVEPTIQVTRSIEVLNDDLSGKDVPRSRSPTSRTTGIITNGGSLVELREEHSSASEGLFEKVRSTSRSPPPELEDDSPEELWKQQQPEFFSEILEKVNGLAAASKSPDLGHPSTVSTTELYWENEDEPESFDDIFEKVKAKPRKPADGQDHLAFETVSTASRTSSIEDIFEPRPPELADRTPTPETPLIDFTPNTSPRVAPRVQPDSVPETVPQIINNDVAPKPIKSILKKRAPAPPSATTSPPTVTLDVPITPPVPPPRSIRKEEPVQKQRTLSEDEDDEDDEYGAWNMVDRHRSSISQTAASARVDPEIMRNVPQSLQQAQPTAPARSREILGVEPPRTLRGMRDYHHKAQPGIDNGRVLQGRTARDSGSNVSEASA